MPDIVCTIGPASRAPAILKKIAALTTRFRLNTGHLNAASLKAYLELVASVSFSEHENLKVTLDLQGAKIRIGNYPSGQLPLGPVELVLGEESNNPGIIPVPFSCVFEQARPGEDLLLLNDGKIRLLVVRQSERFRLQCECLQSGGLSSGKGLNRPASPYGFSKVSDRDRESIGIGLSFPFVDFAVSFAASASDAMLFRPLTGTRKLIGKIERLAALSALFEIDEAFDELWFCRGDLGTEVEPYRLGELQSFFVGAFSRLAKPRLLAGEVLGSMVANPVPSRSEMVHLYDVMQTGFNGIVLSDETAVGKNVEEVIEFLRNFFPVQLQERL